jgi:hypothetical protein
MTIHFVRNRSPKDYGMTAPRDKGEAERSKALPPVAHAARGLTPPAFSTLK